MRAPGCGLRLVEVLGTRTDSRPVTRRLLAPELVIATFLLFGSGVGLLVVGHGGGILLTIHVGSFIAWGILVSVHTLAYLGRVQRFGLADRRLTGPRPIGAGLRRSALVIALLGGVAVSGATYTVQSSWLAHRHHDHHDRFHSSAG